MASLAEFVFQPALYVQGLFPLDLLLPGGSVGRWPYNAPHTTLNTHPRNMKLNKDTFFVLKNQLSDNRYRQYLIFALILKKQLSPSFHIVHILEFSVNLAKSKDNSLIHKQHFLVFYNTFLHTFELFQHFVVFTLQSNFCTRLNYNIK